MWFRRDSANQGGEGVMTGTVSSVAAGKLVKTAAHTVADQEAVINLEGHPSDPLPPAKPQSPKGFTAFKTLSRVLNM